MFALLKTSIAARRSAKASVVQAALAPEAIAKRTKRHLDELEVLRLSLVFTD